MDMLEKLFEFYNDLDTANEDLSDLCGVWEQEKVKKLIDNIYDAFVGMMCEISTESFRKHAILVLERLTVLSLEVRLTANQIVQKPMSAHDDLFAVLWKQNATYGTASDVVAIRKDFVKDLGNLNGLFDEKEFEKETFLFYVRCLWNDLVAFMYLYFNSPADVLNQAIGGEECK